MNEELNLNLNLKILAINSSTKITGIALSSGGKILSQIKKDFGRKQSSELPFICEEFLTQNNLSWQNLNYIALTNGPGYFTGIRVGASYAAGLAFGLKIKLIPVSSLELLKYSFMKNNNYYYNLKNILPVIYAGHNYVYAESEFLKPGEYDLNFIMEHAQKNNLKIISDDPERSGLNCELVNFEAGDLCEIALNKIDLAVNPMELKILYYRVPQGMENFMTNTKENI